MSDITDTDTQKLKSLKTSPVSYYVDSTSHSVETAFGKFPDVLLLAFHVNIVYTYIHITNEDITNCIHFPAL